MAAKHYTSAAKNNVSEKEATSSSQDAMQFTPCTVQDAGKRRKHSWPTLHILPPKKVTPQRQTLSNDRKDKNSKNSKPHTSTDESGVLTMTKKCVRGKNWNKDTQNSCNQMT